MIKKRIKYGLFSTAYLPPVEYFVYLLLSDNVIVEAFETYPRQTYRNRCCIYGSSGVESLNIPVNKPAGNHSKTNEILICYDQPWQRNHWRAICTAYSNAPFFIYYSDLLEWFYHNRVESLLAYNTRLLNSLLAEIGIKKSIELTERFEKSIIDGCDIRTSISPKKRKPGHLPVISYPYYSQLFENKYGFMQNLSIIDLLFNKGPDTKQYLMDCAGNVKSGL